MDTTDFAPNDVLNTVEDQINQRVTDIEKHIEFVKQSNKDIQAADVSSDSQKEASLDAKPDAQELEAELDKFRQEYAATLDGPNEFQAVDNEYTYSEYSSSSNLRLDSKQPSNDPFASFTKTGDRETGSCAQSIDGDPFIEMPLLSVILLIKL